MGKAKTIALSFEKIYVSAPISYIALAVAAFVYPSGWIFLFSVFFAFVLSDLLLNTLIHGGKGHAKIFGQNTFTDKGYAYLVYLGGIVVGTLVSSFLAEHLMGYLQLVLPWYQATLLTDFIALGAVVLDLQWRFYKK